ncbi:hypothetical protein KEM56_000502, partial [Ascosphaera pollenicola]
KTIFACLARLRGQNRDLVHSVRATKHATADARAEIDRLHLHLQNLYYEQRHLSGEIAACDAYDHKYTALPLIPEDEFLRLFPEHANSSPHDLMVARITHEHAEREALEHQRQQLLKKRQALIAENKKRKDDLASLDKDLERFIDLSDRVVLTPPYPGQRRGAIWTEEPVQTSDWTVDLEFRANGDVERGAGSLQLWYVQDKTKVGANSIYSVGQWDGFSLVFDVHGGKSGSVRGFLSDGTTPYVTHPSVDSLAFGHCEYPYRNLGRPSQIQIKHSQTGLEVHIDGQWCFASPKIQLPSGYIFGVSAASADVPDSFEVFKFATSVPDTAQNQNSQQQQPIQQSWRPYEAEQRPNNQPRDNAGQQQQAAIVVDTSAIDARVAGLQTSLTQTKDKLSNDIVGLRGLIANQKDDLARTLPSAGQLALMDQKLQKIERMVESLVRENEKRQQDLQPQLERLMHTVKEGHKGVVEGLQHTSNMVLSSAPKMGILVLIFAAVQLTLFGAYAFYKKRRASAPKKFL